MFLILIQTETVDAEYASSGVYLSEHPQWNVAKSTEK